MNLIFSGRFFAAVLGLALAGCATQAPPSLHANPADNSVSNGMQNAVGAEPPATPEAESVGGGALGSSSEKTPAPHQPALPEATTAPDTHERPTVGSKAPSPAVGTRHGDKRHSSAKSDRPVSAVPELDDLARSSTASSELTVPLPPSASGGSAWLVPECAPGSLAAVLMGPKSALVGKDDRSRVLLSVGRGLSKGDVGRYMTQDLTVEEKQSAVVHKAICIPVPDPGVENLKVNGALGGGVAGGLTFGDAGSAGQDQVLEPGGIGKWIWTLHSERSGDYILTSLVTPGGAGHGASSSLTLPVKVTACAPGDRLCRAANTLGDTLEPWKAPLAALTAIMASLAVIPKGLRWLYARWSGEKKEEPAPEKRKRAARKPKAKPAEAIAVQEQ